MASRRQTGRCRFLQLPKISPRFRRPLVRLLTLLVLFGVAVAVTALSRAVWTHFTLAAAAQRLKAAVPLKPAAGGKGYLPILIPVSDRPQYMAQMVDGLRRVEGIGETVLVFSQDLSNPEVTRLIKVSGGWRGGGDRLVQSDVCWPLLQSYSACGLGPPIPDFVPGGGLLFDCPRVPKGPLRTVLIGNLPETVTWVRNSNCSQPPWKLASAP